VAVAAKEGESMFRAFAFLFGSSPVNPTDYSRKTIPGLRQGRHDRKDFQSI
jgi:hypothetical protein